MVVTRMRLLFRPWGEDMRVYSLVLGSALLLYGCQNSETVKGEPADGISEAGDFVPIVVDDIPDSFRGKWSLGDGSCKQEISDGYLTISADGLQYWESQGRPILIQKASPKLILVSLDMSGEGETWKSLSAFNLIDENSMTRQDADFDQLVPYKRCKNRGGKPELLGFE